MLKNKRSRKRLKKKSVINSDQPLIECAVCLSSERNGLIVIVNDNGTELCENGLYPIASLSDCDDEIKFEGTIFYGPCRKHGICYNCLRKMALSFDNHQVCSKQSFMSCPYPFDGGCSNVLGPYYFSHNDIKKILTEQESIMYMNHVERFQFPGYEIIKCPRPILITDEGNIRDCESWILVPHIIIQTSTPGTLVLECNQNRECLRRSCYHCHGNIRRPHFLNMNPIENEDGIIIGYDPNSVCEVCLTNLENTNPLAFNKYFYNPNKRLKDAKCLFFRNNELDIKTVSQQLEEIADNDDMYSRCFECLTVIYKTEQCNTITHCSIERCYACGRSASLDQDLGDHWDMNGVKGCPRFDHSCFWNEIGKCKFKCREGHCYNDEIGTCNVAEHKTGIQNMINIRKQTHVYHAIKSLLPEFRKQLFEYLKDNASDKLRKLLPRYICSDYRCFSADIFYKLIYGTLNNNAHAIEVSSDEESDDEDDMYNEPYKQTYIDKLSQFKFEPIL